MKYLMACIIFLSSVSSFGQKSGNIWYFGQFAGLDFNTNPPTVLSNGQLNTNEGCSSIADPVTGSLLFYSDGITVWDKNHNPMPASIATPMNGDPSSTQSGVIVPLPGSSTIFYIFTTPAEVGNISGNAAMCYSIVDLSLNGGNGDLTTVNNVLIDSSTEKIAGVSNCMGTEFWIVGHRWNSNAFYAYKLTAAGISAPVITNIGTAHTNIGGSNVESIGYMKFSPDGKKLGLVTYVNMNTMELFDFNPNTGIVSNPITEVYPFNPANSFDGLYGCSFSPDNSKFYVSYFSQVGSSEIFQYDLNTINPAAILASKTVVATANKALGALQNAPDGKIYISSYGSTSLDVITSPNTLGAACNYVPNAQNVAPGFTTFGLPVIVESFLSVVAPPLFTVPADNQMCIGDTIDAPQPIKNTFSIQPNTYSVNADSSLVRFFPTTTTTYTIVNSSACAADVTTLYTVTIVPDPVADFIFDPAAPTLKNSTITLLNKSTGANHYEWYENNTLHGTSTDYTFNNPGIGTFCYTLIAFNTLGCSNTVTKCVKIKDSIASTFFVPNSFTPNGDGLNDVFKVRGKNINMNLFSIYDRFGQLLFMTDDVTTGWDGSYKGTPCDLGIYFYLIHYSDAEGNGKIEKGDITLIR